MIESPPDIPVRFLLLLAAGVVIRHSIEAGMATCVINGASCTMMGMLTALEMAEK